MEDLEKKAKLAKLIESASHHARCLTLAAHTKDRLIGRIFYIVGFVADFFTTSLDYDSFVLTEKGDFKFTY